MVAPGAAGRARGEPWPLPRSAVRPAPCSGTRRRRRRPGRWPQARPGTTRLARRGCPVPWREAVGPRPYLPARRYGLPPAERRRRDV